LARVARGRAPDGAACLLKEAAVERGREGVERESAALVALAGLGSVPAVRAAWDGGVALEWIEGGTLANAGERGVDEEVASRALESLARVHAARDSRGPLAMVHGDLSPGNVHVGDEARGVVLADFGLASWRDRPRVVDGVFRGTLAYAAPEVARGEPFDQGADLFALAASLLHAATGVPLRDPTAASAVMLVEAGTRPFDASHPWHNLARDRVGSRVAEVLFAYLAFDAKDRPRGRSGPC
jgi:serine/threonine protein kinase